LLVSYLKCELIINRLCLQNIGIDKGDIPDLTKAPSSLLDALEQHLNALEGKKPTSAANTPTQTARYEKPVAIFSNLYTKYTKFSHNFVISR
jgi:hypothetical protein